VEKSGIDPTMRYSLYLRCIPHEDVERVGHAVEDRQLRVLEAGDVRLLGGRAGAEHHHLVVGERDPTCRGNSQTGASNRLVLP
jgi:hypothetical protein